MLPAQNQKTTETASNKLQYKCINNIQLQEVSQHPYLSVDLSFDLSRKAHITNITSKAERIPNLLRRHLYGCKQEVKSQAFTSLVHPHLEYSSSVWNPHFKQDVLAVEKIQGRVPDSLLETIHTKTVLHPCLTTYIYPTSTTEKTEKTFNILQSNKQPLTDHYTRMCQTFLWPYKNT